MSENINLLFTSKSGDNPYHSLLFDHLEEQGVNPLRPEFPVFFPLTRSVLKYDDIDAIHLGWLYQFFFTNEFTDSDALKTIITIVRAFLLCFDIVIINFIGIQIVWTIHNKYHHERRYNRTEKFLNIIVGNFVTDITVKCESAKDMIVSHYKIRDDSKISVVPDGNYIDFYPNQVTKEEARNQLGINDKFIYLFFGVIRPYKGVNRLIDEFQEIEGEQRSLWIVGNPKDEKIAKEVQLYAGQDDRIETRLEFVPTDEVQLYLNAADVLVLPYNDILNSGSVHLGLSFAAPMIVPRLGCIPETIPGSNLLYDPQSKDDFRSKLLNAPESSLSSIGNSNRQRAQSLTWDMVASKYIEIYDKY